MIAIKLDVRLYYILGNIELPFYFPSQAIPITHQLWNLTRFSGGYAMITTWDTLDHIIGQHGPNHTTAAM